MSMLHANSPVPLYEQLYRRLRTAIQEGSVTAGGQLPSERQLAANYGVSRVTARKALDKLQQEGLVHAHQGRGSFVARDALENLEYTRLDGFSQVMLKQGMVLHNRILSRGIVPATDQVAGHLGVDRNERVIKIRRLRLVDTTPIAVHTSYLRYPLCRPVLDIDLERHSLYRVLQERLNIQLSHVNRIARAIQGNRRDLAMLNLVPPAAVTQVVRQVFDRQGHVVEFFEAIQREDIPTYDHQLSRL